MRCSVTRLLGATALTAAVAAGGVLAAGWLLDPVTLKMMPMGTLPPSGQASYGVSASLMAGYSAVDISLQANNGNPAHSAVSVLRGSLAAGPPSA
jgi:hypothetical protein